jgi:hypothetical protein
MVKLETDLMCAVHGAPDVCGGGRCGTRHRTEEEKRVLFAKDRQFRNRIAVRGYISIRPKL